MRREAGAFDEYLKKGVSHPVPQGHPEEKRIKDVLESVAVLTNAKPPVPRNLAGHFYPMAYVRDMAAPCSLIKSGYVEEGKNVLEYWYRNGKYLALW